MIFENPNVLWSLLAIPPILIILALWGWRAKKEAVNLFLIDMKRLKNLHIEKYILSGLLLALFTIMFALPKVAVTSLAADERVGEVILCVDVSTSMAAQQRIDSASRLDRVKEILYTLIDRMERLGQVKVSLYGFTNMGCSLVPLVGTEDYSYLRKSINNVLDILSVPGDGTDIGQSIQDILKSYSAGAEAKLLIVFSDGDYYSTIYGSDGSEKIRNTALAIQQALNNAVKIISVGVGEVDGAKIPLYDENDNFTGRYSQKNGKDYITYLNEADLKEYATRTEGEYFTEKDIQDLINYVEDNLSIKRSEESIKIYQSVAHWFLIVSLPIWIIFVKRHVLN
ncbi:MAG: VWA domain-containing protein [Clostridiales bacterium]|nr:VWA domain-containing protein [Clostridiales bacterium]